MTKSVSELIKEKRQQIADKRMGSKNTYRFKTGVTKVRILPGWRKDDPTFYHSFGQMFIKNMDGKTLAVVGDRRLTLGEDDPVRSLIQRAMGEARTDAQRAHYKDMLASPRELVNGLILDDKEIDPKEPQIIEFSETQFDQILEQAELAGITDEFLDLENGFDLMVSKTGSGINNTKYSFTFARKSTSVDSSVMENLNDLDAFVRSKLAETDRAVNALKSLMQGDTLVAGHIGTSYSGSTEAVDGEFDPVEEAKDTPPWEDEKAPERKTLTPAEIDKLFTND